MCFRGIIRRKIKLQKKGERNSGRLDFFLQSEDSSIQQRRKTRFPANFFPLSAILCTRDDTPCFEASRESSTGHEERESCVFQTAWQMSSSVSLSLSTFVWLLFLSENFSKELVEDTFIFYPESWPILPTTLCCCCCCWPLTRKFALSRLDQKKERRLLHNTHEIELATIIHSREERSMCVCIFISRVDGRLFSFWL